MTVYAGSENWQACGEIAEQIAIETEERSLLGMQAYAEYFLGLYDIHCNQLDAALARLQGVAQAALEMKFIWIELKAQQAFAQVLARLNQDNQPAIERISVLLDYLAKHTQESPYHQAFHLFHDNLVHNLNIVPH